MNLVSPEAIRRSAERTLRVLVVHNHYQHAGGEDQVLAAETSLLRESGHRVSLHTAHNDEVTHRSRVTLAATTIWSHAAFRNMRRQLRREQPDVVHVHNTLPLLSPSVYYAAHAEGVPVVQTLHNFRLLCPNGLLLRDGKVCEDCVGRIPLSAVAHRCYRSDRAATSAVGAMITMHRFLGTWNKQVDLYIAPTEFARGKFGQGGLPLERIRVKPHFVSPDPGLGSHQGGYALFVGRLSPEKGLDTLLDAWRLLRGAPRLKIVGDGPLAGMAAGIVPGVEWMGRLSRDNVLKLMREASFLVFPSHCYETFGMTLVEAFATGLPVLCSHLGAAAEIVQHEVTGRHFRSGDARDLATQVTWATGHGEELLRLGRNARAEFIAHYTAGNNLRLLLAIYREAMQIVPGQ